MTPGNFNWFLHSMLYYHTQHVLRKQKVAEERKEKGIEDDTSDPEEQDDEIDEEEQIDLD